MPLTPWHRNDELPAWTPTVTIDGVGTDYSAGWTFTCTLTSETGTVALSKTTGITGAADGVIVVAWAVGDLDIAPGSYDAQVTAKRTSDSFEETVADVIKILARAAA